MARARPSLLRHPVGTPRVVLSRADAGPGATDRPSVSDTNRTPGVMVGIWSPKGTFVTAAGVANLGTGERLNTDMQFKIASQTKTFTSDLILQLVGEGRLSSVITSPNGSRACPTAT